MASVKESQLWLWRHKEIEKKVQREEMVVVEENKEETEENKFWMQRVKSEIVERLEFLWEKIYGCWHKGS